MNDLLLLSTLLVVLAWIFARQAHTDGPPLFNNEGTIYYNPDTVRAPSTLREIQTIVVKASKNGGTVRPLGSGHSWQDFGRPTQDNITLLSLYNYRGLVKLDKPERTASFKGGTRLWEINAMLAKHNMALSVLPSISYQTIAGAIATGTHGSGIDFGHLSSYVTNIQLITGLGEVLNISPDTDPELFQAAGVSIGLLGIITQVTLRVEEIFNLMETSEQHTIPDCLENMESIRNSQEHVKMWLELASSTCNVFGASRTKQPSDSEEQFPQPMADIRMFVLEVIQWFISWFPPINDAFLRALFTHGEVFPEYQRIAVSWRVFNIPYYVPSNHREAEVAVPLDKCETAIKDLIELKQKYNLRINSIVEVRFVKGDSFWLSNSYNRDSCHMTLLIYNPGEYQWRFLETSIYNVTHSYGGRPHWGKSFTMDSSDLKVLYPKYEDFMELRKKLDPYGVFITKDMKRTFGI